MFKHHFDFGFEVENRKDVNDKESEIFLDLRDADDLLDPDITVYDQTEDGNLGIADSDVPQAKENDKEKNKDKENDKEKDKDKENVPILLTKPVINTSSKDFGTHLLSLANLLQLNYVKTNAEKGRTEGAEIVGVGAEIVGVGVGAGVVGVGAEIVGVGAEIVGREEETREVYDSLYQFVLHASPNLLKLVLESVGNPQEVALALQRLRIIVGVSEIDMQLEYQYHYIFSCCTDEIFSGPSDWENIISFTMDGIINEIFTGSIYFSNDHEINIIALPANLTECEMEFITFNRIWGIKMKESLLGDLDLFLQLEPNLFEEAQEMQLLMMETFMKEIGSKFPNLLNYRVNVTQDTEIGQDKKQEQTVLAFVALFNSIRKEIDTFLPQLLDKETERQTEILIPHMLSIVS
ncbi:MAG: hypothetical protein WD512_16760 [Candidatus Paceibacterota bacterium]